MTNAPLFDPDGVGLDNGNYFGMPFTTDEAALLLLSAPWDVTVSYGAGTADAPDALIEASTQLDFYDPAAPDAWRRGIATAGIDYALLELSQRLRSDARRVIEHLERGGSTDDLLIARKLARVNEGSRQLNAAIGEEAARWLDAGKTVGLVGGDHATPYGLIRALGERCGSFGILHIDAHCDLREAYEGFEFSHASIMYNVLRDVPGVERIVQVGVRDFSAAERRTAEASGRVVQFDGQQLLEARLQGEPWHAVCDRIIDALLRRGRARPPLLPPHRNPRPGRPQLRRGALPAAAHGRQRPPHPRLRSGGGLPRTRRPHRRHRRRPAAVEALRPDPPVERAEIAPHI